MAESVVAEARRSRPRLPEIGMFEVAVALGALADLATTTFILLTGRAEANLVLERLAAVDPWLAVGAFWCFGALLVGACWFRNDWIGRVAGSYTLVSLGLAGSFNLVLYTTGTYLMPVDPAWYIHSVAPALGVALGAVWLAGSDEPVPWNRVALGGGAFVAAAYLLPMAV